MNQQDWLAQSFEQHRGRLKSVALRMLGSADQAEDAVQEAWIRLSRSESNAIENLGGWLTTVVSRVCLDALRSRTSRHDEPFDSHDINEFADAKEDPEESLILSDSIGQALMIVLDRLTPAERVAFVLHDLFDLSFAEIAPIIDRSEAATRQLASRARRQVRNVGANRRDPARHQQIVTAFLAASREGNLEALIALLHPDAVLRADATAVKIAAANRAKGAPSFVPEIRGARAVAETLKGRAAGAHLALINGAFGAVWPSEGQPVVAFCFTVDGDTISSIDVMMDREKLGQSVVEIIKNNFGRGEA